MKKEHLRVSLALPFLTALSVVGLIAVMLGLPGNIGLPFGYYGDFNTARRAIERSGCTDLIEYSRHEDVTLESFHFRVRTRSGCVVRLWFSYEMDANQVCSRPKGLLVMHPSNWQAPSQAYSIQDLSSRLGEGGRRLRNLTDVLCDLDHLATIFDANYTNAAIPLVTREDEGKEEFRGYLQIEIVDQGLDRGFTYSTPAAFEPSPNIRYGLDY